MSTATATPPVLPGAVATARAPGGPGATPSSR